MGYMAESKKITKDEQLPKAVSSDQTKQLSRPWLKLVPIVVLVLIIATVAGVVAHQSHNQTAKQATKPKLIAITTATSENYPTISAKANAEIAAATTPQAKATLYDQLADNAQIVGNTSDAIKAALAAEQLEPNAARAGLIGSLYADSSDWQNAATWYQKARDLSPKPANSTTVSDYNDYQNLLNDAKSHL